MFSGPFDQSIVKRAKEKDLVEIKIHNLRDWAKDKHKTVDDRPYGGGAGMIIMIQPVFEALKQLKKNNRKEKVILLSPQGQVFNQQEAVKLSKIDHLILICGHYEGVDERIRRLTDEEISIGDYILTGGEIPAMVITDSLVRLIPGVLEKPEATLFESFSLLETNHSQLLLEHPQYTRPENFRGWKVPKILLSGNHQEILKWRLGQALNRTKKRRPDLLKSNSNNLMNQLT